MAEKDINIKSQSKLIGLDSITKTIEHTVVSKFKELTSSLQKELKIELEVPTEITTQKSQLTKQVERIKGDLNDVLKAVQTEFQKNLEKRWQFNTKGSKGVDSKGNPLTLGNATDLRDIREYKNQRLKMIKELANITDDTIEVKDSQQFHKLIQNIRAYEEAVRRLRELSKANGTKYQPDEGDLNLEKIFSGYKFSGTQESNAKVMAKAFVDSYTSTLNSELEAKKAELAKVTEEYNRAIARAANKQEGVGYEYEQKDFEEKVKARKAAEVELARTEAEIENAIRKEIDAYIALENKLGDINLNVQDDQYKLLEENADRTISKLRQAIEYVDKYKLDIQSLSGVYDFFADDSSTLRDYILNGYEQRTQISINPNTSYLSGRIASNEAAERTLNEAKEAEAVAKHNLDGWAEIFASMRDSAMMRDTVDELSAEKIETAVANLKQENEELKQRIARLEGTTGQHGASGGGPGGGGPGGGGPGGAQPDFSEFNDALNSSASAMSNLSDVIKSIVDRLGSIDINSIPVIALGARGTQEAKTQETSIEAEKASTEQKVSNELKTQQSIEKEIEAVEKRRLSILENRRNVQIKLNQDLAEAEQRRQAEKDREYAEQAFATARSRIALKESEPKTIEAASIKSAEESADVFSTLKEIVPVLEKANALSKDVFQFETKDAGLKVFAKEVETTAKKVSSQVQKIYDDLMKLYADRPSGGDKQIDRKIAKKIYGLDQLQRAGYDTSGWSQDIETIRSDIGFEKFKQTPNFTGATDKLVNNIIKLSDEVESALSQLEQRFDAAKTAAFAEKNALDQYEYLTKNAQRYTVGQLVGDNGQDWESFSKEYEQRLEYVTQIQEKSESIVEAEKEYQAIVDRTINSLDKQNEYDAKALEIARARVAANEAAEALAKQPFNNGFEHADPTNIFNSYNQSLDQYLKQIDTINKLETKQGIVGISANEISTLTEAKQKASELYEVLKSFGPELDTNGENWITRMLNEKNLGNLDKWKSAFSGLAESMGPLIASNIKDVDAVFDKLQNYVKSLGGGELVDFSWIKRDAKGIDHFAAQFKDADGNAKKLNATLSSIGGNLRAVISNGKQGSTFMQEFMSGMERRWRSLLQYLGTFASFYKAIDIFKRGLNIVKELDSAFIELKRISNDSASALENFRKKQFELADTVGTTSATIINAATEWEHLGYSIKEAEELAKTSAVYKNIADGMTSDSEATEDLVSILKAYNFTADQAMDVTDALIATSNNYAVTAADIGNILKRSSAALAMGGNSFEETVALGTAMSEVLQSAEVAGSSLKVLSLRLRSSKTELKEMGEETDDLVESTPKLRSQIKALTKGFDILSSDGKTIKSTYEIMKGIAAVWDDMSDVDQAALLELIAGKTRAQGVSALLSNWEQVDKVLQTIAEDEGTALRNNEEKLNTIQGRITKFTNASQQLASDAFNTEALKSFVSFGTEAVNILDKIIKQLGVIPTIIGAIGGVASVRSGGVFNGIQSSFAETLDKIQLSRKAKAFNKVNFGYSQIGAFKSIVDKEGVDQAIASMGKLKSAEKEVLQWMASNQIYDQNKAIKALGGGFDSASKKVTSFGAKAASTFSNIGNAIAGFAVSAGIAFGIQALISVVDEAINHQSRLEASTKSYGQEAKRASSEMNEFIASIDKQKAVISDHNSSIEQVTNARTELHKIQEQMIETYGTESNTIAAVTSAIKEQTDATKELQEIRNKSYHDSRGQFENDNNGLIKRIGRGISALVDWGRGNSGVRKHDTAMDEVINTVEAYQMDFTRYFNNYTASSVSDKWKQIRSKNNWDNPANVVDNVETIIDAFDELLKATDEAYSKREITEVQYKKYVSDFEKARNKAQSSFDSVKDYYDAEVYFERIQKDENLNKAYNEILSIGNKYSNVTSEKDRELLYKEYLDVLNGAISDAKGDSQIIRQFNSLFPILQTEAKQWEFESKLNLKIDKGETKKQIQQALDELQKTLGNQTITKEMLDEWDDSTHTSEQNAAYSNFVKTLYDNGAAQAKSGIEAISNSNMISTNELEDLKDYLNDVEGIDIENFYKRIDTSTLKSTKDLRSKFSAALNSVKDKYKDTTDAAVAAWKIVERSEDRVATKTKEISGDQLSKIEGDLSKLKNDIFDSKGNVKTTTFKNKDFLAAFADIPDFVNPAINALDKFKKVVTTTTDKQKIQKAFDELATSYIWNLDEMKGLTEENAKYVEGALSQGGVVNATEMVASAMAKARAQTALNTIEDKLNHDGKLQLTEANQEMDDSTLETINGLVAQENAADGTQKMLANLLIQQMLINGTIINTDASRAQLEQLAKMAGYTADEFRGLAAAMALSMQLDSLGVSNAEKRRYTNAEGADRQKLINNRRDRYIKDSAKNIAETLEQATTTGPSSSGGSGGGGGSGNKEPSKTDKELDYVNRRLQILQEYNDELRENIDNQYVILQDAKENAVTFQDALSDLGSAQRELDALGVGYKSDEFQQFIDNLDLSAPADEIMDNVHEITGAYDELNTMLDDTPGMVQPSSDTQPVPPDDIWKLIPDDMWDAIEESHAVAGMRDAVEDELDGYDDVTKAVVKYKTALEDLANAKDATSKTLSENGTGQLTYIKQLQESDKELIDAYKEAASSYSDEWADYQKKILESWGEEKGQQYIKDILYGNMNPEEWERIITYNQNDQAEKDKVELLERGQTAYDHQKESLKTMREWQQKLNEDIQKEYEMRLNIVKAEMVAIENKMNEAQFDLDMKEILGEVVQEADYQRLIDISGEQVENYRQQLDVLNEQLDTLDEGEQAWYDCKQQIVDCENSIRDCVKQQAEWNEAILRMPVENISRFLGLIQNLGQTLKNWLTVNDAKGIAQTAEQIQTSWKTAYDQITDSDLGLMKQLKDYEDLLENYDLGQNKFSEVDDEIQGARDSVESLVEEMIELNKQLLTLPIDKISEMTEYLDGTLSDLQQIQSDYETTINTVIDLINQQTEKIQEEYEDLQKKIEDQIKPLQDQIDALEKANEKRDRQLQIENALYELEKAREQHTVQVIRNGQVRYEADAEAVRNAQQGYDDAQYNKLIGDLQDKIDALNKQLSDAEEATNDQVDALNNLIKNRWETIMPDTERNRNEEIASQFFKDMFGVSNWKELVLAGKDANGIFADERIYQGTRAGYEQNSIEMRDTQRQIDINNLITDSLTRLVEDFQADKINSEQLNTKVNTLMGLVSDGVITGQERLTNTLSLGDYSNLGAALTSAGRQRKDQIGVFRENLKTAQTNRDKVNTIIGQWGEFKVWYDKTYKQLYKQYKEIDFIGDTVAKWYDDYDDDSGNNYWDGPDSRNPSDYQGENLASRNEGSSGPVAYADGLTKGSVGKMSASDKFKAIQALGLRKLDPDEFPAILHLGEGVINPKQQSTMLGNVRQALALGASGGGAVIQMSFGDITLPSVTNGQDFAESLATQFQPAMNQIFSKIFRR